jgi:hypothetical protein
MRTQKIYFPDQQKALCVFPNKRSTLERAISELRLGGNYPVIVLIGGEIDEQQTEATQRSIQTISKIASDLNAVIICGGTDMDIMAEISQERWKNHCTYPLIGVAPKDLVTWPGGPRSTNFLWWGRKRRQLGSHYSHFILVPGSQFGDESPWVVETVAILSKGHRSVTILVNGEELSRKDIEFSLKHNRPDAALSRTVRLTNKLSSQPKRHKLITAVPENVEQQIVGVVQEELLVNN